MTKKQTMAMRVTQFLFCLFGRLCELCSNKNIIYGNKRIFNVFYFVCLCKVTINFFFKKLKYRISKILKINGCVCLSQDGCPNSQSSWSSKIWFTLAAEVSVIFFFLTLFNGLNSTHEFGRLRPVHTSKCVKFCEICTQ